ncbi:putative transcriptional regulator with CopG/Arc/MetJ DNA-binding domain and metal-binding domain [Beggiatoa alba B18LD]|uniref:Putative nickel-responsive regulator n=1 Tax=Beggiatoa alba B18LD TaxID=395493 RepID=I3CBJ3_9GAMM|nr:nickel-responsive transcriptional regulator NikR [Beggiatoa alba]EIJ40986.1 putative transcriptional regulator with CopG/Arc/MetJ DNA-binding domain and metal-binding domain [Beggiatoa alba B18LD]
MSDLARLSFSLEPSLVDKLELLVSQGDYSNRSEYIRDMIRAKIVEQAWEADEEAIGTITLVYNHHSRLLNEKLTDLQHDYHPMILATTHVHLDAHLCAEMIMVRGHAGDIRKLSNLLQQPKGVLHATLSMTSTGKQLL